MVTWPDGQGSGGCRAPTGGAGRGAAWEAGRYLNIVVVGCGRLGAELSDRVFRQGHKVTVIDRTAEAFGKLAADFRGRMLEGDVMARDVLDRARLNEADALAAVTSSDAVNAVIGHVAREVFHVGRVAVRNYDPRRRPLQETFAFQVVSSSLWGAARFESVLTAPALKPLLAAGNGEVSVYEVEVPAAWDGRPLAEFVAGVPAVVAALTRGSEATLPDGDTVLREGDRLLLSAGLAAAGDLAQRAGPE
jgi:trk system potassium uptake protein TrkA